MDHEQFFKLMQQYVANIAISGSTLRNQGAEGVTGAARDFLTELDLSRLKTIEPADYAKVLAEWTSDLVNRLPEEAQNWGTARKGVNVFMVQVFLNRYLPQEYKLEKFKDVLETPLDSQATAKMRNLAGRRRLPRGGTVKGLTQEGSLRYQEFAAAHAREQGIPRACLDIMLWRAYE